MSAKLLPVAQSRPASLWDHLAGLFDYYAVQNEPRPPTHLGCGRGQRPYSAFWDPIDDGVEDRLEQVDKRWRSVRLTQVHWQLKKDFYRLSFPIDVGVDGTFSERRCRTAFQNSGFDVAT